MYKTWCWATVVSMLDVLCPLWAGGGGRGMRGLDFTLEEALQPLDGASVAEGVVGFHVCLPG